MMHSDRYATDVEYLEAIMSVDLSTDAFADAAAELLTIIARQLGANAIGLITDDPQVARVAAVGTDDDIRIIDRWVDRRRAAHDADQKGAAVPETDHVIFMPGGGAVYVVCGTAQEKSLLAMTRIAVERIMHARTIRQVRSDLDRTMARILESDERLIGRIGLDIHDGPTQHLSVGLLEVQLLQAQMADVVASGVALPSGLEETLDRIYEILGGALTEMRELIGYLRPARFQGRSLSDILQDVVTAHETRTGARVKYLIEGDFPIDGVSVTQRITFYRILQESMTNADRHGQATEIDVHLHEDAAGTTLHVRDNGNGFDATAFSQPVLGSSIARFGLHGMRDRTAILGGEFSITSAPGEGCLLRVHLPRWSPLEQTEGND
jgi:signal transduction histidine kinase